MSAHEQDTIKVWFARPQDTRDAEAGAGFCDDLIERFVDVVSFHHGFDPAKCAERRDALRAVRTWLQARGGWGLLNASSAELQCFVEELAQQEQIAAAEVLREFYTYLRTLGIRRDNPAVGLTLHRETRGLSCTSIA
jgi:Site-specific recombinase XerD